MGKGICPKCGGTNINYQIIQTGSVGAGTNKVVIEPAKRSHGLLYWFSCVWMFKFAWWLMVGWWWRLLFGGKRRGGLNFNASHNTNKTMAICQDCGHSWKA